MLKNCGIKQGAISAIELQKSAVTEQNIKSICLVFNVNEEWLRSGTSEIFVDIDKNFNTFIDIYKNLSIPLQDFLLKTANDLLDLQDKLPHKEQ